MLQNKKAGDLAGGISEILCKHHFVVENRSKYYGAAAGLSGCRLIYNITLAGADVKGGEAVHLPLTSGIRSAKKSASWA